MEAFGLLVSICLSAIAYTVKPVYNGQPWDSKKLAVVQKWPLSRG
jgi:hypothetical protein